MSSGDVHIVTGMDAIVNLDNIKPGIDLKELERQMISGGLIQRKIKDPQDRFNDELTDAANKLGISFGEFTKKRSEAPPLNASSENTPVDDDHSQDSEDSDSSADSAAEIYAPEEPPRSERPRFTMDLQSHTQEQKRRSHIDSVMGSEDGGSNFSFEKEKREDIKCAMLAEIDSLMSSLANEDIDLTRIPRVDRTTSYDEVDSVLKMLRHKNDHTRYCSFAEEFLLFGAYALEELFDGRRTWFGRYQPDLTGWHNPVNVKLKRMRHDTGQVVSGIMQDYNIGPGARVLLELVPNMVLYSKMRKQQHGQPGLFSDAEMAQATQNLREH